MNSSVENVEQYCKNVANIVHGIYLPLNVFIALVDVVIWTKRNEIQISEDDDTTCGTEECCDLNTCNLNKPRKICRPAATECDLPEYCTGKSEYCLGDVYKIDGEICSDGIGYCYQGFCGTRSGQCKVLWGPTGESRDELCYLLNTLGYRRGHCDHNLLNETYSTCNKEDVACGLLQCRHLSYRLEYGLKAAAVFNHSFLNSKKRIVACRNADVDLGLDTFNPGIVPNGAKFRTDRMCVNQKCVSVASVQEGHKCPHDCHGNALCNNLVHCYCDVGFILPHCQHSLSVVSVDSGPLPYSFTNGFIPKHTSDT